MKRWLLACFATLSLLMIVAGSSPVPPRLPPVATRTTPKTASRGAGRPSPGPRRWHRVRQPGRMRQLCRPRRDDRLPAGSHPRPSSGSRNPSLTTIPSLAKGCSPGRAWCSPACTRMVRRRPASPSIPWMGMAPRAGLSGLAAATLRDLRVQFTSITSDYQPIASEVFVRPGCA